MDLEAIRSAAQRRLDRGTSVSQMGAVPRVEVATPVDAAAGRSRTASVPDRVQYFQRQQSIRTIDASAPIIKRMTATIVQLKEIKLQLDTAVRQIDQEAKRGSEGTRRVCQQLQALSHLVNGAHTELSGFKANALSGTMQEQWKLDLQDRKEAGVVPTLYQARQLIGIAKRALSKQNSLKRVADDVAALEAVSGRFGTLAAVPTTQQALRTRHQDMIDRRRVVQDTLAPKAVPKPDCQGKPLPWEDKGWDDEKAFEAPGEIGEETIPAAEIRIFSRQLDAAELLARSAVAVSETQSRFGAAVEEGFPTRPEHQTVLDSLGSPLLAHKAQLDSLLSGVEGIGEDAKANGIVAAADWHLQQLAPLSTKMEATLSRVHAEGQEDLKNLRREHVASASIIDTISKHIKKLTQARRTLLAPSARELKQTERRASAVSESPRAAIDALIAQFKILRANIYAKKELDMASVQTYRDYEARMKQIV